MEINENSAENVDYTTLEGFKHFIEKNYNVTERIEKFIYAFHDLEEIMERTNIYADERINRGDLKPEEKDDFIKGVLKRYQYKMILSQLLHQDLEYEEIREAFKQTKAAIKKLLANSNITSNANGTSQVITQQSDGMYIKLKQSSSRLTNFVIQPLYTVLTQVTNINDRLATEGYGEFLISINTQTGQTIQSTVELRSYDFETKQTLRNALRERKIHGTYIYGDDQNISRLGEHLFFSLNVPQKTGLDSIGIKQVDGRKVIVTPNKVYDLDGNQLSNYVYVKDEVVSVAEIMKLQGMSYDPIAWQQNVLPLFVENILNLHKRSTMITLLGWIASIPFETIVREVANLGGHPHFNATGVNGGGKTGVLSTIMPYLGYGMRAEIPNFGTQFANSQAVGTSYQVIVIFDEFRPHEWSESQRNQAERLIRESYNRGFYTKGQVNLSTRRFSYCNPVIFIGQRASSDPAIAERTIPDYFDVNFLNSSSPEAIKAKETYQLLNNAADKNFWSGFLVWGAKQDEQEVLMIYKQCKDVIAAKYPQLKEREIGNYAVVPLGLHYFKKLADEYGLNCNYTEQEIYDVVDTITEHTDVTLGEKSDDLTRFLEDLAWYGNTYGNDRGAVFGIGKTVATYQPTAKKDDVYGKDKASEKPAEIRGRKVLLVKIDNAVKTLAKEGRKYDEKMLLPIITSYFQNTKQNQGQGLVLAPNGYRANDGRYTAFNWDEVKEMFNFVEELQSDANLKQELTKITRPLEQDELNDNKDIVKH